MALDPVPCPHGRAPRPALSPELCPVPEAHTQTRDPVFPVSLEPLPPDP